MKTRIKNLFRCLAVASLRSRILPALLTGLGLALMAIDSQAGVVLTTLHSFTGGTNGVNPQAALVQGRDGNFYGTTYGAPAFGANGTVFKISTNGALTTLHSFSASGWDGANPQAALVQGRDGDFYGTTSSGGGSYGTVFKISTNGALTSLYSFGMFVIPYGIATDGANPEAALVQGSDGNFYGTTSSGGEGAVGTVFKISTNGTLITLHSFSWPKDGDAPYAGLVQGSDGYLYGTTAYGGTNNWGNVFQISTNGALTNLYYFTGTNDGAYPYAGLVQGGDGSFYGTTLTSVFKVGTNGVLTSLHSFGITNYAEGPNAGLVKGRDGYFYGTMVGGGTNNLGTVFKISTNGALTTLYSFTGSSDGSGPNAVVQGSDGNFYGTTYGTVFRLTIVQDPPQLTIIPSGTNVILTWPTNFAGFDYTGFILQSTTNLVSPAGWSAVSPGPVVINGQSTVTNPISGIRKFYRLSQ
jgi:uncharacterized repeat protein (TIGR03803 family)